MKIADADTIRAIDKKAVSRYGIKGLVLMENAGRGVAEVVVRQLGSLGCPRATVSVFAGKGNNGGDGYVAARHLVNAGARPVVYSLASPEGLKGDAAANADIWHRMGGATVTLLSKKDLNRHTGELLRSCVVVDAIFGTGLAEPVKGFYADVIEFINSLSRATVVAADIPSGIDASTGAVLGCAVRAAVTATMAMPKIGLCQFPGRAHAGRVEVVDIGVPKEMVEDPAIKWNLADGSVVRGMLRPRPADAHKGLCGHLLVVAGSPGKTGAAYMAAVGGMRVGAGLATIALPEDLNPVMEAKTTEVMTAPLPQTPEGGLSASSYAGLKGHMEGKTALVFGPGLGGGEGIYGLLEKILREASAPVVIDADGLNCLAGRAGMLRKAKCGAVLTPHPGEMGRLLGCTAFEVQKDRTGAAKELCARTGAVVVLKGAATVVASPGGQVYINPTGNAALATAGTGDVLSGMIGGLISQGLAPVEASVAAVHIHGLAAEKWSGTNGGDAGMMATDLLGSVPGLVNSFTRKEL